MAKEREQKRQASMGNWGVSGNRRLGKEKVPTSSRVVCQHECTSTWIVALLRSGTPCFFFLVVAYVGVRLGVLHVHYPPNVPVVQFVEKEVPWSARTTHLWKKEEKREKKKEAHRITLLVRTYVYEKEEGRDSFYFQY